MTSLLVDRPRGGVALLTLNRPDVLNAIDMELAERGRAALAELAEDASARAIVITGAGALIASGARHNLPYYRACSRGEHPCPSNLSRSPFPTRSWTS